MACSSDGETRNTYRMLVWKHLGGIQRGRRENNVKMDVNCEECKAGCCTSHALLTEIQTAIERVSGNRVSSRKLLRT
jgi:hypothetical protein